MFYHTELGNTLPDIQTNLRHLIRSGQISRGGYKKGKIYGLLNCGFGKRMKMENRVFFESEQEAIQKGYRPCAHCLPREYKRWKATHYLFA